MAAVSQDGEEVNIKVAVRCRPMNDAEKKKKVSSVITCMTEQKKLVFETGSGKKKISKTFSFDKVFGQYSTQREVFTSMVAPVVDEVMQGFNCTVFAYGQTGTGKTHTMEGNVADSEQMGIIPRSVHYIFDKLEAAKADFNVRVSYLELYNEELGDLLGDEDASAYSAPSTSMMGKSSQNHAAGGKDNKTKKLMLCDSTKGVVCNNLTEVVATSPKEALEALHKGINQRQVAETQMNKASSRSHSIFTLKMMIKEITLEGVEQIRYGQLNLVDLAGSECVARSGATGARGREAGNINQSLLTLGRVINALVDPTTSHVPYRDSKLTRLLQESLGGRAKTCIVATLSPSSGAADETLSTLNYADTAKGVKNTPVINNLTSKRTVLKEYSHEMDELRLMLQSQRDKTGTYLPTEKYEELLSDLERSRSQLSECEGALSGMREEVLEHKSKAEELGENLRVSEAKCVAVETELGETKETLVKTSSELLESETQLFATRAVVDEQVATEGKLTGEADEEGAKLEKSAADLEGIFDKVQRAAAHADQHAQSAAAFGESALESAAFLKARTEDLQATVKVTAADLETTLAQHLASAEEKAAEIMRLTSESDAKLTAALGEHTQNGVATLGEVSGSVQAMQQAAAAANAAQTAALQEAAASVAKSVRAVLEKLEGQQSTIASATEAVSAAAEAAASRTATFVAAHCVSLDAAREAHAAESKTTCDGLAAHVAAVRTFASGQRDELLALAAAVAQQREGTATAAAEVLAAEQAAASERAVLGSKELQAATDGFAADAEALMQQMAVALGALKQKHADVLSEAAVANSSRITTGAETHAGAMNKMFLEHDAAATEATETQAKEMAAGLSAFEESAGDAMSVSTAAVQASNSTLSEAMGGLKQSAQNFAQETSVETTASADATKQTLMDLNESCTHAAGECNALGTSHETASAAIERKSNDATKESAAAAEHVLATAKRLTDDVSAFPESAAATQKAREEATTIAGKQQSEMGATFSEKVRESLADMSARFEDVSSAHAERTSSMSDAVRAHVEEMRVPVSTTNTTPKKRAEALRRIAVDNLSKTRSHQDIISEATVMFRETKSAEEKITSVPSRDESVVSKAEPAPPAPEPETPSVSTATKGTRSTSSSSVASSDAENSVAASSKKRTVTKGSGRSSSRRNSKIPAAADAHMTTNPLTALQQNSLEE